MLSSLKVRMYTNGIPELCSGITKRSRIPERSGIFRQIVAESFKKNFSEFSGTS